MAPDERNPPIRRHSRQDLQRHLVDAVLPNAAFLIGHEAFGITEGVVAAVAVAGILVACRLAARRRPTVVFAAFGVVVLHAATVVITGDGRNFFLPWLLVNTALILVFALSVLRRRPVTARLARSAGLPDDRRAHLGVTALWTGLWVLHLLVGLPLYALDRVVALGVAHFLLGPPALLLWGFVSWRILRRLPPREVTLDPASGERAEDPEVVP